MNLIYRNKFNYEIKKKLLALNENISILLEIHNRSLKAEEKFWREFIKNQRQNESEMVGGLKPVFFHTSELNTVENEKAKLQKESLKHPETKFVNFFNNYKKIGKKCEACEKANSFPQKYHGLSLTDKEFDVKEREFKLRNEDYDSKNEEFEKKEIANLIENINNYSIRKLSNMNYTNKNLLEVKFKKFNNFILTQSTGINGNIKNIYQDVEMKFEGDNKPSNGNMKNNINQQSYINNCNGTIKRVKNSFLSDKLKIMEREYNENKARLESNEKECLEMFERLNYTEPKKINENEALSKTNKSNTNISNKDEINLLTNEEMKIITEIRHRHEIIKDIFLINNHIKYSNYSDSQKDVKKLSVRKLTTEIEEYRNIIARNKKLLTPAVKANLDLLNYFFFKVKPNSNSQQAN